MVDFSAEVMCRYSTSVTSFQGTCAYRLEKAQTGLLLGVVSGAAILWGDNTLGSLDSHMTRVRAVFLTIN